jgi:hypothetical protein
VSGVQLLLWALFGSTVSIWSALAWLGIYRGWTKLPFGSTIFMGFPTGIGVLLVDAAVLTGLRWLGLLAACLFVFVALPLGVVVPDLIGPSWWRTEHLRKRHGSTSR